MESSGLETRTFLGCPKETGSASINIGAHLDLSAFTSWVELVASLGLDRLKSALMALGVKCGDIFEEKAQRLLSIKGAATLDPILLAKMNQRKPGRGKNVEKQNHATKKKYQDGRKYEG